MSAIVRRVQPAGAAFALLVCLVPVLAAQAPAVRVELSIEKTTFIPGEPVIAYVTLTNLGEPRRLPAQLDPEYHRIRYFVARGDEPERQFQPWASMENDETVALPAGASATASGRIFFGAEGWTFPSPGAYAVRAAFGRASSEPARIEIVQSTDAAERAQSERLLGNVQAGFFLLFDGGDHLTDGIPQIRQIAESKTRLAGYASHALGASYAKRFADARTGVVRPPDLVQAEGFLARSRELLPADALSYRVEGLRLLSRVVRQRGRGTEADQLQQQLDDILRDDILRRPLGAAVLNYMREIRR